MVQASPSLCARLRFSTKQVGRGFYRGNRVGSTGSHTQYGGYIIDWRKVRNYNLPDLTDFKLTPYVTREINTKEYDPETQHDDEPVPEGFDAKTISETDTVQDELQKKLIKYLRAWRRANPSEFEQFTRYQYDLRLAEKSDGKEEDVSKTRTASTEQATPA